MLIIDSVVESNTLDYYRKLLFAPFLSRYFDLEISNLSVKFSESIVSVLRKNDCILLQEVGVELVDASKMAQLRCEALSSRSSLPQHTSQIYEILVNGLINDASLALIDIYYKQLSTGSITLAFEFTFLEILNQLTAVVHLIEKYYTQIVYPLTVSSVFHEELTRVLPHALASLEGKIDCCLDKFISVCVASLKSTLSSNTSAKERLYSGDDTIQAEDVTSLCTMLKRFNTNVRLYLDTKNFKRFGLEFGIRFAKFLTHYYKEFSYSFEGAMVALCDIRSFKSAFSHYELGVIDELFDTIYSLLNLLVVSPADVANISKRPTLEKVDPQLIQAFVERRKDYKKAKIGRVDL